MSVNTLVKVTKDSCIKVSKFSKVDPNAPFQKLVIQGFAKAYEKQGIRWSLREEEEGDSFSIVETREKLAVCTESEFCFDVLLKKSRAVKDDVEKMLELPALLAQIKQHEQFSEVQRITLAKVDPEGFDDFASFHNCVVRLGTSNWFLALIDEAGNLIANLSNCFVPVNLSYGSFCFTHKARQNDSIGALCATHSNWWLVPANSSYVRESKAMLADVSTCYEQNLKILSGKRLVNTIVFN